MRDFAAILIAASMLPAQAPLSAIMQQRLSLIPQGTVVELRTFDKKKVRGRIGVVSGAGFAFQRLEGARLIDDRMSFDRVESVKELKTGRSGFEASVLNILSAVGALSLGWIVVSSFAG